MTSGECRLSFEVIELDALNEKDPEIIPALIKDYHRKNALYLLANSIINNLKLHELYLERLLSEFMKPIIQADDSRQRERLVRSWKNIINWFSELWRDGRFMSIVRIGETLKSGKPIEGDRRFFHLSSYLDHMLVCPAVSENNRARYLSLKEVYKAYILNTGGTGGALFSSEVRDLFHLKPILKEPVNHTVYIDQDNEERLKAERQKFQAITQFISNTLEITDQEELFQRLQEQLPEGYDVLIRFKNWLGENYLGKSYFDNLITFVGNSTFLDNYHDPKKLISLIESELNKAGYGLFEKDSFEGISVGRSFRDGLYFSNVYISNPYLHALLPLFVIKKGRDEIKKKAQNSPTGLSKHDLQRLENWERFNQELVSFYQSETRKFDNILEQIREKRELLSQLEKQTGISGQQITTLKKLAGLEVDEENRVLKIDELFYSYIFNALALYKKGLADASSLIILLRESFAYKPEETWQELEKLFSQVVDT